jgi:hypothetical protein
VRPKHVVSTDNEEVNDFVTLMDNIEQILSIIILIIILILIIIIIIIIIKILIQFFIICVPSQQPQG